MTKYEKLPDNLILELINKGDKEAEEYMLLKYMPLVKSETRFLYLAGAETEDLAQEGMIGLFTAIRDYDAGQGASFITFATTCVRNRIHTALTSANRQKHAPLNSYISLFYDDKEDGGRNEIDELASDEGYTNPEYIVLRQEQIEQMYEELDMKLSPVERSVAKLYIKGLSRREIAEELGKNEKSVDNALTRIHEKLKKSC